MCQLCFIIFVLGFSSDEGSDQAEWSRQRKLQENKNKNKQEQDKETGYDTEEEGGALGFPPPGKASPSGRVSPPQGIMWLSNL